MKTSCMLGLCLCVVLLTPITAHDLHAIADSFKRGTVPMTETDNWCARADVLGTDGWGIFYAVFMNPKGHNSEILYAVTNTGTLHMGSPPANATDRWLERSDLVGTRGWNTFKFMFFDINDGNRDKNQLYAVSNHTGVLYKGSPPTDPNLANEIWVRTATRIGVGGWHKFDKLFYDYHGQNIYAILDGNFYRGSPPTGGISIDDWINRSSTVTHIGTPDTWDKFKFLFFDYSENLHAVTKGGEYYKGPPPSHHTDDYFRNAIKIGTSGWADFKHLFYM